MGQDHISQTLLNALKNNRLPHALLFTGPRGTGKTSSARLLAKSLRCPTSKDFVPCNVCKDCEYISLGRSFDVFELDGASNNGVDAVRDLQEGVRTMPSSGKYKIYIIDEVHMLSISAFNALLKTLEEPPAHVVFILATTEVQKIPNTILSRCQRFDFRRIPVRQVADHLKKICVAEKVKFEEEALWTIARQGGGSMRDSQSLLDQVITYTNADLGQQKVINILGLTDRSLLLATLQALCLRDAKKMLEVIQQFLQSGHDPSVFSQDLLEQIRHLLLIKLQPDRLTEIVDLPESEMEVLAGFGAQLSEEDIHMLFDMTLKGCTDIARASDPRIVLEMLLMRMVLPPKVRDLAALLKNSGPVESPKVSPPAPPPAPKKIQTQPVSQAASQPVPNTKLAFDPMKTEVENWYHFVLRLKEENAAMAAQLENTHVLSLTESELVLGLPESLQFLHDQLKSPKLIESLRGFISRYWGKDLTVSCKIVVTNQGASAKETATKKQEEKDETIRQTVEKHPLVQSAQRILNAQITRIDAIKERS